MSIYFESERLIIREFTEMDLPFLVDIANEKNINYWCPDWKNCQTWVNDWFKGLQWRYSIADPNKEYILLAIIEKSTNRLVGQVNTGCEYNEEFPGELSVGYFISENATNNGYATEAVKAITDFYFQINKNEFFYAVVKPANLPSIRVVTKAGFTFISEVTLTGNRPDEKIIHNYYRLYRK